MTPLFRASRRAILQAGTLGLLGGGFPSILQAGQSPDRTKRAKRCIFLFMWGGPSQLDTLDPKPDAPAEIRGEFKTISSAVPNLRLSEHFRGLSTVANKVAVIRSLNHDDPAHLSSAHTTLTGHLPPVNKSDAEPPSSKDTPHLGSVMSHLRPAPAVLPSFVTLPWRVAHPAAPGGRSPGQTGGWLGQEYDPFVLKGDPNRPDWQVASLSLLDGISPQRMADRKSLLGDLDRVRRQLDLPETSQQRHWHSRAFQLLAGEQARRAFDLGEESAATRDRYGRNTHGQCVLLARRLVEHGVPVVSVNWHNDGRNFWDTHGNNFNRLKNDLIPPADRALTALLGDLDERGLLDETLVVWVGEFGRNPRITAANAGREHWPHCYSGILAGGGIRGGTVYGASDKFAAHPADDPVSPHDLMATVYHALGVPKSTQLMDRDDRPQFLYAGKPLTTLFG